jgi:hypothetical protein
MLLRSAWSETSLAAPGGAGTIDSWAEREGIAMTGPIPLETFLAYADWFRQQFVRDHDPADIVGVARTHDSFRLRTSAGEELAARRLVLAVGVTPFPYAPPAFATLDDPRVRFATEVTEHLHLEGRRVVVVGGGQAALESAGLAARAGANVELVTRSPIRWFADREPDRPRSPARQRLYRLAYPAVGYGPPPLNRLVLHPDLYAHLPSQLKRRLTDRLLRPGGSPWLRTLVDGHVTVTEGRTIEAVEPGPDDLRLRLSDGSARNVDDAIVATGYRFALNRLGFLDPQLTARLRLNGEVAPTLRMLKARGTTLVLGLRDIMDEPSLLLREWKRKKVLPALERLYDEIWVYGLAVEAGQSYWETDLSGPLVLVVGSEANGLGRLVRETCDGLALRLGRRGLLRTAAPAAATATTSRPGAARLSRFVCGLGA